MKNLIIALAVGLSSSSAVASWMECSVNVLTASTSGLMPSEKPVALKIARVQDQGNLDLKKCSSTAISDLQVTFCAIEDSEALGVYMAEIVVEDKNETDKESLNFTSGNTVLATPKKGRELVGLMSRSALSPIFIKKMIAAKLDFPDYQGGDSLQIDLAVEKAVKAGAINFSDIVSLSLDSCQLK